jgi:hypothetical protein
MRGNAQDYIKLCPPQNFALNNKGCVIVRPLPFTLKRYLKAKEGIIMEIQIFHHAKIYNLPKKPLKERNPKSFKILL